MSRQRHATAETQEHMMIDLAPQRRLARKSAQLQQPKASGRQGQRAPAPAPHAVLTFFAQPATMRSCGKLPFLNVSVAMLRSR